jgi:hypothetical protein
MTTQHRTPRLLAIATAGFLPFAWLVLGWFVLNALLRGSALGLALATFALAISTVVLGAALLHRSGTRRSLVLTCGLLFVTLAAVTWLGPTWVICGMPVEVPRRILWSVAEGALAAGGYGLATAQLEAPPMTGLGATVGRLLVVGSILFLALMLGLGLYMLFINPALACAPFRA